MCLHAGPRELDARAPVARALRGELARTWRDRHVLDLRSRGCRAEHKRAAEETHKVVLLW